MRTVAIVAVPIKDASRNCLALSPSKKIVALVAADIYCHFVIEAALIAPRHLGALRDILAKERAITEGVPRSIRLDSGEILSETLDRRIFGAVEYAKDGLLPILERIGPSEWLGHGISTRTGHGSATFDSVTTEMKSCLVSPSG